MNAIRVLPPGLAKAVFLAACGIVLFPILASAGFTYGPRDLILGLRQTGGPSELVVNLGQVCEPLDGRYRGEVRAVAGRESADDQCTGGSDERDPYHLFSGFRPRSDSERKPR